MAAGFSPTTRLDAKSKVGSTIRRYLRLNTSERVTNARREKGCRLRKQGAVQALRNVSGPESYPVNKLPDNLTQTTTAAPIVREANQNNEACTLYIFPLADSPRSTGASC